MLRALGEFEIGGVKTLIGFHRRCSRTRASSPARRATGSSSREELAERGRAVRLDRATTVAAAPDGALSDARQPWPRSTAAASR